jgi:hypothetical protein
MTRTAHENNFDWAILESLVHLATSEDTALLLVLPDSIFEIDVLPTFGGYSMYRVEWGESYPLLKTQILPEQTDDCSAVVFVDMGGSVAITKFLHTLAIPVVRIAPEIRKHKRDATFGYECTAP